MMNKPMMGQQPAPAAPTGMSFQSDPGMRSQFKGFMSGMAARNMPAPQPQPAMMMPTMPQQMSSVDIFQPVMGFARGGGVPGDRSGGMGGYGGEARGSQFSGGVRETGGERYYSGAQAARNVGFDDSGDSGDDALANMIAREAARIDAQDITARGGMPLIEEGFGPTSNVVGMAQQPMVAEFADPRLAQAAASVTASTPLVDAVYDFDTSDAPDLLQNFGTGDPEIAQDIRGQIADIIATNRITSQTQDLVADAIAKSGIATPMPRPSTLVDYSDPTMVPRAMPSAPPSRPTPPRPAFGVVGDTDDYTIGEGGEFGTASMPQMESVMDRALRKDGVQTSFPGMQNLQQRAESQVFDTSEMAPGIGAALAGLANKIGQGVSGKVLEKVQAGGTPVYGPGGMIVGVYDQSGPFGSTVYTGRPGYENPALARQISLQPGNESTLPEGMRTEMRKITDPQEDDAAFSFLKLLKMQDGGEVPGFFRGGDVPGDREGTQGSGGAISGGVRDSGGATSYSADEISFGGDDSGDSGTQTIMATPTPQAETQTITATPSGGQIGPQSQDVVPATLSEGTFKTNMQVQDLSPRDRIAAVEATAKPSFGELAMDLLNVGDLLSSYQDAGMDVTPTLPDGSFVINQVAQDALGTAIPASLQSITPQAAGIQQGIQGLQNVSTQRQSSGFSLPSIPSLSEIGQAIMGTRPTYDNLTRAR